jgi:hypothetical protein
MQSKKVKTVSDMRRATVMRLKGRGTTARTLHLLPQQL